MSYSGDLESVLEYRLQMFLSDGGPDVAQHAQTGASREASLPAGSGSTPATAIVIQDTETGLPSPPAATGPSMDQNVAQHAQTGASREAFPFAGPGWTLAAGTVAQHAETGASREAYHLAGEPTLVPQGQCPAEPPTLSPEILGLFAQFEAYRAQVGDDNMPEADLDPFRSREADPLPPAPADPMLVDPEPANPAPANPGRLDEGQRELPQGAPILALACRNATLDPRDMTWAEARAGNGQYVAKKANGPQKKDQPGRAPAPDLTGRAGNLKGQPRSEGGQLAYAYCLRSHKRDCVEATGCRDNCPLKSHWPEKWRAKNEKALKDWGGVSTWLWAHEHGKK